MGNNNENILAAAGKIYIKKDGSIAEKKEMKNTAIVDFDRDVKNVGMIIIENISPSEAQHETIQKRVEAIILDRTGEDSMAKPAKDALVIKAEDDRIAISLSDGWITKNQADGLMALLARALTGEELCYKVYKNGRARRKVEPQSTQTAPQDESEPTPEPPAPEAPQDESKPTPEPPAPEAPQDESKPTQEPPAPESKPLYYEDKPIDRAGIRAMMRKAAGLDPNK